MRPGFAALLATVAVLSACQTSVGTVASPSATAVATATPATPAPSPTPSPTASPSPSPTPEPDWTAAPVAAEDPDGLARQLIAAERAIRDPNVTGVKLTYYGHMEQLAISSLNDAPQWKDQVLGALPDDIRKPVAGTLEAGRQLRQLHGPTPKALPEWHIVEPAPAADLLRFYKEGEQKYGVPWYYLASINLVESRMGRIRGDSTAGAQGPMQFIPSTWASYGQGGDVNDPHDAILAAARYLKAAGAPGDMDRALYAYNHSQAYVNAIAGYALVMRDDASAFRGYYGWQVYYTTVDGTSWLKVGWSKPTS